MATLENVHHDFPRLARNSGFYFQLHRGRVNWSEIENLDVNEIVENRNFHLLEHNLINVINCNLEREYDLKILDRNFVKLFTIAQLGVDYLSYCEMYLDRCVVLLQEQLIDLQEKCKLLKQENQKRKEELNRSKKKNKIQSYQCKKCEKVFISDVYLKFHNKRRHENQAGFNGSSKKYVGTSQKTEDHEKLSVSTQTLFFDDVTVTTESENACSIKMEYMLKIEKLEQELQDLKKCFKKLENSQSEQIEVAKSSVFPSFNGPGSMHYNSMLMLLPSYLTQSSNHYEINPRYPGSVPEVYKSSDTVFPPSVNSETQRPSSKDLFQSNTELEETFEKESELPKGESKSSIFAESFESSKGSRREGKEVLECDKENIDSNIKMNLSVNLTKPLPPPRKSKMASRTQPLTENKMEQLITAKGEINSDEKAQSLNSYFIVGTSTPTKKKSDEKANPEISEILEKHISEVNEPEKNSKKSICNKKPFLTDPKSKSFIKKLVTKNSPKLRKFSESFKKSLTNLYDSVSSTEKDFKKKELDNQNPKRAMVDGLNKHLRQLGVDPEWSGIPKKTLKQKLNALKFQRKLLSNLSLKLDLFSGPENKSSFIVAQKNPTYPIIRQNMEEKIFQNVKQNLERKKIIDELYEQGSVDIEDVISQDIPPHEKPEFVSIKDCAMYNAENDTEADTESKISNSEKNLGDAELRSPPKANNPKELISFAELDNIDSNQDKELNFSTFQLKGGNLKSVTETSRQKQELVIKGDELSTDSETESHRLENLGNKSFKSLNEYISNYGKDENNRTERNDNTGYQFECSNLGKVTGRTQYNLEKKDLQPQLSMNAKKKVLFLNYLSGSEGELSDSPTDDLWSFKSYWEKDSH